MTAKRKVPEKKPRSKTQWAKSVKKGGGVKRVTPKKGTTP